MTAAAQQQQAEQQDDTQLVAAAAIVVGSATTVAAAMVPLAALFAAAGITRAALRGALEAVLSFPPEPLGAWGPAQAQMSDLNRIRRSQFLVAAARRITADLVAARSRGQNLGSTLLDAIARERRYYALHIQATTLRAQAAARVDSQAALFGRLLGWYTVHDSHTTAECRAADGKNFYADAMPIIGYPGTVHPRCRCLPGRPHPGARLLASARMAA